MGIVKGKHMKKMLVVSDIDGTLLNSEVTGSLLEEQYKNKIKAFTDAGHIFTVATGRPARTTKSIVDNLGSQAPYIINNGAKIVAVDGSVIYENSFILESMKGVIEAVKPLGVTTIMEIDGQMYCMERTQWVEHFEHKESAQCKEFQIEQYNKEVFKVLVIGDVEEITKVWLEQGEALKSEYRFIISEDNYFEIVKADVSKGHALKKLSTYLGIDRENVFTVGNHLNDKELLAEAGMGFAVANGKEELKEMAHKVTKGCYSAGVMEVIDAALEEADK